MIGTKTSRRWIRLGTVFHIAALLTALASLGAFVWGVERVVTAVA